MKDYRKNIFKDGRDILFLNKIMRKYLNSILKFTKNLFGVWFVSYDCLMLIVPMVDYVSRVWDLPWKERKKSI